MVPSGDLALYFAQTMTFSGFYAKIRLSNVLISILHQSMLMLLRLSILLSDVFINASFAYPKENRLALVVFKSAFKAALLPNPAINAMGMPTKL